MDAENKRRDPTPTQTGSSEVKLIYGQGKQQLSDH